MSRMPRRELIEEPVVGIYHCVQRAVRRAFLCGQDAVTGRNFDHRKAWIQDRLEFLAGYFGIEVLSFAVSVYVDLNPIRAGIATTPETSQFTSAYERIQTVEPSPFTGTDGSGRLEQRCDDCGRAAPDRDSWLSPVELQMEAKPVVAAAPSRRVSDKGFLPVSLSEYLRLVDWTGRQTRPDKRGQIPAELAPILTRLQLSAETWVDTVLNFGRWFKRAAGRAESLTAEASRRGRHWLHGLSHSRAAFA